MPIPNANPFLDAALSYAARGWRVVPLMAKDKRPWVKDWVNAASVDPAQLGKWWSDKPSSNVGVALGEASGLVAIDVDTQAGMERLLAMSEGDFPATSEIVTGKGSRFLFAIPQGLTNPATTKVIKGADGQEDLRFQGTGGQCVMPPSIHPTGKTYAWVEGRSPEDIDPAPMPAWLVEEMCKPEKADLHEPAAVGTWDAGGDFSRRGDWWSEILEPAGFTKAGSSGAGVLRFTRPGKEGGVSVTLGHYKAKDGTPALYVFSGSIAELPPGKCFDKFGAYTRLFHGGNFKLAAEMLARKGYGVQRPVSAPKSSASTPQQTPANSPKPSEGITAADLVKMEFPPIKYALDGLLIEGITILGGRPKKGKSWLSLMLGWAVAGGHILDGRKTTQGDVLYLALEDTRRRLKERLLTLQGGVDPWPVPSTLHLHTSWPKASEGGLQLLGEWLEQRKGSARFVIIDTLAKFRTPPKGSANGYAEDYEAIAGIKALADTYGCSVLVVHHTRKLKADDPFDELSGTLGLTGAADGIWMLDSGEDKTADLFVTGRDVPESTIPLIFDAAFCRWRLGETVDGVVKGGRVAPTKPNAVDQCKSWLRDYLSEFASSSKDIEQAAKQAGFSFNALREAKAALGKKGTGELTHHNFGGDKENEWWSGIGPVSDWKFRPGVAPPVNDNNTAKRKPGRRDQTGESGDTDTPSDLF